MWTKSDFKFEIPALEPLTDLMSPLSMLLFHILSKLIPPSEVVTPIGRIGITSLNYDIFTPIYEGNKSCNVTHFPRSKLFHGVLVIFC